MLGWTDLVREVRLRLYARHTSPSPWRGGRTEPIAYVHDRHQPTGSGSGSGTTGHCPPSWRVDRWRFLEPGCRTPSGGQ
ncbi:hypothetical protein ABZ656_16630 [Streptomyces sp. NPDC007095]|uniref:hypothetical protein n=1 Tax=Streptomyces sp. NPDC007095 TaxID=3154482 RepID=UPI000C702A65